ncbi:MAG: carbamoyl-phosphate synthase large subunit, partial [Bdellovibrionales bacterium]|nr:carbamoyl-phosphate synthase large subunit [Bdellovibrionales bacterium]
KERPDALIPTLGGQTALNLGLQLARDGVLRKLNIEMIGATPEVIESAEDREKFNNILKNVGARFTRSKMVRTFKEGLEAADDIGFPIILRPNYTLGGGGGGVAYSKEEYASMLGRALSESPSSEVLVEESIFGWKEFELEIMRDSAGTFVVICSIENFDPCGVHTGDSITVAPQQTLSESEYQEMRDEARKILDAVGLECGGANIQFAVNPKNKRRVVIEMNPRVSRSSALASKATGFPIAKIAALLAIGYRLDEIQNDITKTTPSCYEPALDYVVTKIPRFAFEKFTGSKDQLSTQMKSVGEVMSIGRTFQESFQKALSSLEFIDGFEKVEFDGRQLAYPSSRRILQIAQAFREGKSFDEIQNLTMITPWFLEQIEDIIKTENELTKQDLNQDLMTKAKRKGFSDAMIAKLKGMSQESVRQLRHELSVRPAYFQVDTCAGEFASETPYFYSTYWSAPKQIANNPKRVMIIGSGPNRIGQGIEFDYCCVRGVKALQHLGYEVIMVNSNPETVSTDYDTSDQLYFEPLVIENVLEIVDHVKPMGVILQLGGQTPLALVHKLHKNGVNILGSSVETIDFAEDRARFKDICEGIGFEIPAAGLAYNVETALACAKQIGYPLICRPSYVLGGRRMEIIERPEELENYFQKYAADISEKAPCFMDQFLSGALEIDVDVVRGDDWSVIGGVIEHIEAAGVHSGDSMGVIPPQRLKTETLDNIEKLCLQLAAKLKVLGHLNVQLAVRDDRIFIIEANPRCSRTVPFLAKAAAIPLVDLGIQAMLGMKKAEVEGHDIDWKKIELVCVKGVVFPFKKFPEADSILGPEMKSTGESMGRGQEYAEALMKAFISSHYKLPDRGEVFLSLRNKDKDVLLPIAKALVDLGFQLSATQGTARYLFEQGVDCIPVKKVHEGRPHCVDRIRSGKVAMVINTTSGRQALEASFSIRRSCTDYGVPCITEDHAAEAFVLALNKRKSGQFDVYSL